MINFGDDKTFIENFQRLKSSRKMGELYHCDKKSVLTHAKKIGYDYSDNKEIKIANVSPEVVIQQYEELKSAKKVAELYHCSDTAVLNYLKAHGYTPRNANAKLADVSDEEFIESYDTLKSAEKMSKKYSCSTTAILNHAKKIGYDSMSNKEYKLTKQDKENIIALYNEKTSTELAKQYHVSRGMITKIWFDARLMNKINPNPKTTEIDLTGQQFGYWTVLGKTSNRTADGEIKWKCRCKCGIERGVASLSLRNGTSLSCGAHSNISKGNEKVKNY